MQQTQHSSPSNVYRMLRKSCSVALERFCYSKGARYMGYLAQGHMLEA